MKILETTFIKDIVFLFIFLFTLNTITYSQNNLSRKDFGFLVDEINYQFAKVSLKDLNLDAICLKVSHGLCYTELRDSVQKFEKNRKLFNAIDQCKLAYDSLKAPMDLKTALYDTLMRQPEVIAFKKVRIAKNQDSIYQGLVDVIKHRLNQVFEKEKTTEPLNTSEQSDTLNNEAEAVNEAIAEKPEKTSTSFFSSLNLILLLLSLLLGLGCYYFFTQLRKKSAAMKRELEQLRQMIEEQKQLLNQQSRQLKEFRIANEKLHDKNKQLQKQLEVLERDSEAPVTITPPPRNNPPEPYKPTGYQIYNVFYMPIPNRDGSFDNGYKSSRFDWTESVYKFEVINEEGTKALFSVVDDPRMVKRALNGYDSYIRPACKAANAFNINATSIRTEQKGKVTLHGRRWQLEDRAVIRYSS